MSKKLTHPVVRCTQLWLFEHLYRHPRLYELVAWAAFGGEWHRWRQTVLRAVGAGRVLDLGCGTGALLPELNARAVAIGLDRSPSMLRAARRRASGRLVRADARALPFRDGTFTTVVSAFPAPFILSRETLEEIARVLRPGGRFVVVIGGEITAWQGWRRPIGVLVRQFYGARDPNSEIPGVPLHHAAFEGTWEIVLTPRGRAVVWTATRREGPVESA
ncbi:MAG: class I SAM-dependent methyltransferase [Sphaerobacter sp.]|nr:class I SAM-dependent methyltransferase [Sphaerobacter sp.]